MILSLDYETRSDENIGAVGSYKYIESSLFLPLLLSYAVDDGEVRLLDFTAGDRIPGELEEMLLDPTVTKCAWNCAFEREVTRRAFGIPCPPEQWQDTMILAAQCGLPMKLADASAALLLPEDKAKMKEGRDLIRWFCIPDRKGAFRSPTDYPEKWEVFKQYNRQDVEAERHIHHLLSQWEPSDTEHRFWCLDARINDKGIRVDRTLAEQAVSMGQRERETLTQRAIEVSGLRNPGSVAQIKEWLLEQEGIEVPTLNKKEIAGVVASLQTEEAKEFMELRSRLSKASIKKYDAILRSACADDHIRGCFQFYGANRTGRFAGRLVQLQNLPQNHMEDLAVARSLVRAGDYETVELLYDGISSTLSELIRTSIIPEPGHRFVIADYSAIEARVTAWLAGCEWRLDTFRNGGDIYCASASQMFHVPVVKHGENGHLRQKGKIAELALGYGGGVNALRAFGADKMGMTGEDMAETISKWREASPEVCALWRSLEKAAVRCAAQHIPTVSSVCGIRFEWESPILWMVLPSGRRIAYYGAQCGESSIGTGKCLSYMGVDQTTKKWERVETWGGKLTENLVQATARDCLRDAMLTLTREGWDIRAHVHDEIICTEPTDGRTWRHLAEAMSRPLPWAPGLPLRADGYECEYYMKD